MLLAVPQDLTYGKHTTMESDAAEAATFRIHITNEGPLVALWIIHLC